MGWYKDYVKKARDSLKQEIKDTREHWKSQIKKHRTYYQAAAVMGVAMIPVVGPAAAGGLAAGIAATKRANEIERQRRALAAAAAQRTQDPASFQQDVTAGGEFGLQVTPEMKALIPLVLVVGLVAYVVFKA